MLFMLKIEQKGAKLFICFTDQVKIQYEISYSLAVISDMFIKALVFLLNNPQTFPWLKLLILLGLYIFSSCLQGSYCVALSTEQLSH